ncbi:hypothetical protein Q5P01_013921 [Channa striata]|uniref:C-type lectin domain-containing protein n=1 Tax=Channa striata TaxID=64152 RepID=A0AA88SR49_CHASR|nr:hypothetical protein Q5P01_013921 [Channa striata]
MYYILKNYVYSSQTCIFIISVHNPVHDAAAEHNLTELLQDKVSSLTEETNQLNDKVSSLTEETNQLNDRLNKTTEEVNCLQSLCRQKKTCPAGWSTYRCSCYFLSSKAGSWERGRQDCKDREADLVVIDSDEEQKFLSGLTTAETWSWIGLTESEEGTWKWIDGFSLTLSYWEEQQPDNGGGNGNWGEEDCAHIRTGKNTNENWNDRSCNASLLWICEKEAED